MPTLDDMPDYRCRLYDELYEGLGRRGVEPGAPEYALYHNVGYVDRDIDMEAAVAVDEGSDGTPGALPAGVGVRLAFRELPAVREMASVVHKGSAWEIPQAITALFAWVGADGYQAAGPYREIHLYGRENDFFRKDPANVGSIVVEVQAPVERA